MKARPLIDRAAGVAPILLTLCLGARGATVVKSPTGTDLNAGASWGGTAPAATDIATWTGTSLGAALTLGADAGWQGISVTGAASNIDISGAGILTLGNGGIDLANATVDLSISNNIALGADQSWKAASGRTVTSAGTISGPANLTAGSTASAGSFSGYLSPSSGSPTTVFPATSVATITSAGGVMNGGWIGSNTPAGTYHFSNNGTLVTYQLQFYDGSFTKVAKVQMSQSGADVVAHQVYAKYKSGNHLGANFDSPIEDGQPPVGSGGYGVISTTAVFGSSPSGVVLLSGSNNYTGSTTVSSGTLRAGSSSAFGTDSAVVLSASPGATLDLNGFNNSIGSLSGAGTVALANATLTLGTDNTSPAAFTGIFTGPGTVVKTGSGQLTLTMGAASDFTQLVVSSGTTSTTVTNLGTSSSIVLGDASTGASDVAFTTTGASITRPITVTNNGTGAAIIGSTGGTFNTQVTGLITLDRPVTITAGSTDRTSWTGKITGNVGTLTITGGNRTVLESASGLNDFTGSVVVTGTGAVLQIGAGTLSGENIPDTSDVTVEAGAILKLANVGTCIETINGLNGDGIVRRHEGVGGTQTLVVGAANGSGTFSGPLQSGAGPLAFVKAGTGTQTLTGVNTYTGPTTINGGILKLGTGGSIANTSSVTVAAGATFDAADTGFTLGAGKTLVAGDSAPGDDVTGAIVSEGTLRPGGNSALGTITGITSLTLGGTMDWEHSAGSTASDSIAINGTLVISPGFTFNPAGIGVPSSGTRSYTVVGGLTAPLTAGDIANLPTLPANYTWDTSDPAALKITHVQPGASLTWAGTASGNWDLTASNWTGGSGVFQTGDLCTFDDSATGTTTVEIPSDLEPGSVVVNNSTAKNYTIGSAGGFGVAGTCSLIKTGNGLLTLTAYNIHSGGTILSDGVIAFDLNGISTAGPLTMDGGTLRWHGFNTQDISAIIDMVNGKTATFDTNGNEVALAVGLGDGTSASLVKTGEGNLALGGTGTWTGGTQVLQGILTAASNTALGSSGIVLGTGSDASSLMLANRSDIGNPVTVSGAGTGPVTLGADASGFGLNAATYTGLVTLQRPATISSQVPGDRLAFEGRITGAVGTLTIDGGSRTTFSSILNDFTGDIVITGSGTVLQASVATAAETIPDSSSITVDAGAVFQLASFTGAESINGLSGSGEVRSFRDSNPGNTFGGSLVIGAANGGGSFEGSIADGNRSLSVTKTGSGTQLLSGLNTYTGNTVVDGGTLHLQEDGVLTFRVTNTTSNSLTGTGTVLLDGSFAINVAAVTAPGTWQLENAGSLPGAYGATFQVTTPAGVPWADEGGETWSFSTGSLEFTFDETTGTLTAVQGGFASWIAGFGLAAGDQGPDDDPDQDGVSNLVEYAVAGRSPNAPEASPGNFAGGTLSFNKRPEAAADPKIGYRIEESDDLGETDAWAEASAAPPVYTNDANVISYTLPTGKNRTFARLVVIQLP